ncbi:hypothetical protein CRYUN_Cryun27aG0084100 [Craigia yunnanensis]
MFHILSSMISNQNNTDTFVTKDVGVPCKRAFPRGSTDKRGEVPVTEEQVRGIFIRYDTNEDGRLSKQELKEAFASLGSRIPGVRVFLALQHADTNGDGYITATEFEKLVDYTLKRGYKFK